MHEDGAAAVGHDGLVVVAQDHDQVVKTIRAPEGFGTGLIRLLDRPVVSRITGRIAPAVGGSERADGKSRAGLGQAIGTKQDATQRKVTDRGAAVAFAFLDDDAAATQRAGIALAAK